MSSSTASTGPVIVWFRLDLRLSDQPALSAALATGRPVIPLFIWDPEGESPWSPGGASNWWLHQSLASLSARLESKGSRLILRSGNAGEILSELVRSTGASAVYWNRRYEPVTIARDTGLKERLRSEGLEVQSFNAALLHEPWTIQNQSGKPFQVFTPFWKKCLTLPDPPAPLKEPTRIAAPASWPDSEKLAMLGLEPRINWASGMRSAWSPGEEGAHSLLEQFLSKAFRDYKEMRNLPGRVGTSRLSPHLHFGEISPREIWQAVKRMAEVKSMPLNEWRQSSFLSEVGWREFAHHLLFHFPHTPTQPLRSDFERFPWRKDDAWLKAWQRGKTGYPLVDAGMRELWTTGWMHNRVRMVVGSFLVKDLLIAWQEGARWFWDTLVDADLAQNTLGWQWISGCGADAAPYFRIFNPTGQGEKFDPDGDYIRRWCPELARLPAEWIHCPDKAPDEVLRRAGVVLGSNYPHPIVAHSIAREVALEALASLKSK